MGFWICEQFSFSLFFSVTLSRGTAPSVGLDVVGCADMCWAGKSRCVWAEAGVKQVRKGGRGVSGRGGVSLGRVPKTVNAGFGLGKCRSYSSHLNLPFPFKQNLFSPVKSRQQIALVEQALRFCTNMSGCCSLVELRSFNVRRNRLFARSVGCIRLCQPPHAAADVGAWEAGRTASPHARAPIQHMHHPLSHVLPHGCGTSVEVRFRDHVAANWGRRKQKQQSLNGRALTESVDSLDSEPQSHYHAVISSTSASPKVLLLVSWPTELSTTTPSVSLLMMSGSTSLRKSRM